MPPLAQSPSRPTSRATGTTFRRQPGRNQPSLHPSVVNGLPAIEFLSAFDNYFCRSSRPRRRSRSALGSSSSWRWCSTPTRRSTTRTSAMRRSTCPALESGPFANDPFAAGGPNAAIRAQVSGFGNGVDSTGTMNNDSNFHAFGMQRQMNSSRLHTSTATSGAGRRTSRLRPTSPPGRSASSSEGGSRARWRIRLLQGSIAEVVVVNTSVLLFDVVNLNAYFTTKYNLP